MAEDDRDWAEYPGGWARQTTQLRCGTRPHVQLPPEPLLKLEYEQWHNRGTCPFRTGLAKTTWQLAQATSLAGKHGLGGRDDILVVLALPLRPQYHQGWALAALFMQRIRVVEMECIKDTAIVTEMSFSTHVPHEREQFLSVLLDAAQHAVLDIWHVPKLGINDAVLKKHAHWLQDRDFNFSNRNSPQSSSLP
ncbi:hypothetical protein [Uliginosibacterium gangwonense]|uniref:hypothetical protein n=1 Tax=Uliginosibacterium gangwonense TaxID=392736 RepID=UPI00037CE41C|nr:hypothetical protein [Uliginosibacterium gangwonense]